MKDADSLSTADLDPLDAFLLDALENDLLDLMLAAPRLPVFCRETLRPGAAS